MKIPALLTTVWVIFSARSSLILLYDVNCHRLQLGAGPPVVARMAMHLAKIKRNLHILFAKDRNGIRGGKIPTAIGRGRAMVGKWFLHFFQIHLIDILLLHPAIDH